MSVLGFNQRIVEPSLFVGHAIMVFKDKNRIDGIDRWGHDAVVVAHNLVTIPEILYASVGQLARKHAGMNRPTVGVRLLEVVGREHLVVACHVDWRHQVASRFFRTHAVIIGDLEVLLHNLMEMPDWRDRADRWCVGWLQAGGHIFMIRHKFHVDNGRLVTEKDMLLAKHLQQVSGKIIGDERYVLRVIEQDGRMVAFLYARRESQQSQQLHDSQIFRFCKKFHLFLFLVHRTIATLRANRLPLVSITK